MSSFIILVISYSPKNNMYLSYVAFHLFTKQRINLESQMSSFKSFYFRLEFQHLDFIKLLFLLIFQVFYIKTLNCKYWHFMPYTFTNLYMYMYLYNRRVLLKDHIMFSSVRLCVEFNVWLSNLVVLKRVFCPLLKIRCCVS